MSNDMAKALTKSTMGSNGFEIRFPETFPENISQGEEYVYVKHQNGTSMEPIEQVRFHDYETIYSIPGLYEYLFYDKLKCQSPQIVCELLQHEINQTPDKIEELKALDVGAGNGMVGEELQKIGVESVVGIDILEEAAQAVERDRPEVYDEYFVLNLIDPPEEIKQIENSGVNCLTTVSALGFNDIPPAAFSNAYNLVDQEGWVAFNLKDNFLETTTDNTGFSGLIYQMVENDILQIKTQQPYRHRYTWDGTPLLYSAIIGKKVNDIPQELISDFNTKIPV